MNFAHFNLVNNIVSNEGVRYIAFALATTSHIVSIDLSMNKIGHEGAKYLSRALTNNNSLICLNISSGMKNGNNRNYIGISGAEHMAKML